VPFLKHGILYIKLKEYGCKNTDYAQCSIKFIKWRYILCNMTNYVALNIGFLLSSELEQLCRNLNTSPDADAFSDFGKANNNPHVTLAMGVFEENDIENIVSAIRTAIEGYNPIKTTATNLYRKESEQIGQEYQLQIQKTDEIATLYKCVMDAVRQYISSVPATRNMFSVDEDETWEPNTTHWVDGFKRKKPEDYNPHISLKCRSVPEEPVLPIACTVDTIVIAKMGNYCSSRDVLGQIPL
jgi:hypothetical protein